MEHTQVLIVGAGPTGLTAAHELTRHGIACRIIDKKLTACQTSNALAMQPRTLEVLNSMGVIDAALAQGRQITGFNIHQNEKILLHLNLRELPSRYQFILAIPQSATEKLLTENLQKQGVNIERGYALTACEQQADRIKATLTDEHGKNKEITADWLLACDGGHSIIRQSANINFIGQELPQHFIMTDVDVEWNYSYDEAHAFFTEQGAVATIAVGKKQIRLIVDVSHDQRYQQEKNPQLSDFEKLLQERQLTNIKLSNPSWVSGFWIHERYAEKLRQNRIFLLGDAAHLHSPIGGQGMNTGIQDAFNLSWKLAWVIKRQAPQALLDTYQQERLPLIKQLIKATTEATKIVTAHNSILKFIRNSVLKILNQFNFIKQRIAQTITELNIRYAENQFIKNASRKKICAGMRLPDIKIASGYLQDLIADDKLTVLLFGDQIAEIKSSLQKDQRLKIVADRVDQEKLKNELAIKHGVIIVRPDRMIAYRQDDLDFNRLKKYLQVYL